MVRPVQILAFLSCICESSVEGTSLNEASMDIFIPRLHNDIQFSVLTFLEVASFHAHKLPTIILFKNLNFYVIIKKNIYPHKILQFQSDISNVQLSYFNYKFCEDNLQDMKA